MALFHPSADASSKLEDLIEWSKSTDVRIRENIARNPNTPKEVLVNYAYGEPDANVLMALADNFKMDSDILLGMVCNNFVIKYRNFVNWLAYKKGINDKIACILFDKGCRVLDIANKLDVGRLMQWRDIDEKERKSYFDILIGKKQEELIKLWKT